MYFIVKGFLPPSILYKLTGIPCPTTGMYRSLIALFESDSFAFINNNPIVVFFLPLIFIILIDLLLKFNNKRTLKISLLLQKLIFFSLLLGEIFSIKNYLL
jgi:hypothetical protein